LLFSRRRSDSVATEFRRAERARRARSRARMLSCCFRGDEAILSRQNSGGLSAHGEREAGTTLRYTTSPLGLGVHVIKGCPSHAWGSAHLGQRRCIVAKSAAKICKNLCLSWRLGKVSRKGATNRGGEVRRTHEKVRGRSWPVELEAAPDIFSSRISAPATIHRRLSGVPRH
jgi:hypothetical protein